MNIACFQDSIQIYERLKTEFSESQITKFDSISDYSLLINFEFFFIDSTLLNDDFLKEIHLLKECCDIKIFVVYDEFESLRGVFDKNLVNDFIFLKSKSVKRAEIETLLEKEASNIIEEKITPISAVKKPELRHLKDLIGALINEEYDLQKHLVWISKFLSVDKVFLLKQAGDSYNQNHVYASNSEVDVHVCVNNKSKIYLKLLKDRRSFVSLNNKNGDKIDDFLKSLRFFGAILLNQREVGSFIILFGNSSVPGRQISDTDVEFVKEFSEIFLDALSLRKKTPAIKESISKITEDNSPKEQNSYSNKYLKAMATRTSNDFKNALVSIKTFTQLFPDKYKDPAFRKDFYKVISHEVNRLESLMDVIGFFSSEVILQGKTVNLSDIICACFDEVKKTFSGIKLKYGKDDKPIKLFCDEKLMFKVFLAIFTNAAEAMSGKGTIKVEIPLYKKQASSFINIIIENSGPKIDEGNINDIFNPFFSTKPNGLGLGLTFSKKVIESHGGDIEISNLEDGIKYRIMLPVRGRFMPVSNISELSTTDN